MMRRDPWRLRCGLPALCLAVASLLGPIPASAERAGAALVIGVDTPGGGGCGPVAHAVRGSAECAGRCRAVRVRPLGYRAAQYFGRFRRTIRQWPPWTRADLCLQPGRSSAVAGCSCCRLTPDLARRSIPNGRLWCCRCCSMSSRGRVARVYADIGLVGAPDVAKVAVDVGGRLPPGLHLALRASPGDADPSIGRRLAGGDVQAAASWDATVAQLHAGAADTKQVTILLPPACACAGPCALHLWRRFRPVCPLP